MMNNIAPDEYSTYSINADMLVLGITCIEIHGVIFNDDGHFQIDDENPQAYSGYVRYKDGTCQVIADAGIDVLDLLRSRMNGIGMVLGWEVKDFVKGNTDETN
jgi:hypothetical protein